MRALEKNTIHWRKVSFYRDVTVVKILFFLLITVISNPVSSQDLSSDFSLDPVLPSLITEMDSLVMNQLRASRESRSLLHSHYSVFPFYTETVQVFSDYRLDELRSERAAFRRDIGLHLRSSYSENVEQGLFSGGNIFYNRRFQTGLHIDLLRSGWLDNRERASILGVRQKVFEAELIRETALQNYEITYDNTVLFFGYLKMQSLIDYFELVTIHFDLVQRLHYLRSAPWDDVLELSARKARLENMLIVFEDQGLSSTIVPFEFEDQGSEFHVSALPSPEIYFDRYLSDVILHHSSLSLSGREMDQIRYNPLRDVSLSLHVNYNIFDGIGNRMDPENFGGREYFTAGVSFSLPLPLNTTHRRSQFEAQRNRIELRQNESLRETERKLYQLYHEYRLIYDEYRAQQDEYLKVEERIRRENLLRSIHDPEFSILRLTEWLSERHALSYEMLQTKEKMYLQLVYMDHYLPTRSIFQYLKEEEPGFITGRDSDSRSFQRGDSDSAGSTLHSSKPSSSEP